MNSKEEIINRLKLHIWELPVSIILLYFLYKAEMMFLFYPGIVMLVTNLPFKIFFKKKSIPKWKFNRIFSSENRAE